MTVWIDVNLCDTCSRCIKICPYNAIVLSNNNLHITSRCTDCGFCVNKCKKKAVLTDTKAKIIPNFTKYKGIWVFVEYGSNGIKNVSAEILGKAQALASVLKEKVTALVLGYNVLKYSELLGPLGADEVLIVDNEKLKQYDAKSYATLIKDIVETRNPNIFLFGATYIGRDLAPRVAKLIGSGLTADCTNLAIDPDNGILIQTRPAFGGNILATIVNRYSRPQMATVRPGVMAKYLHKQRKTAKIESLSCNIKYVTTKVVESIKECKKHVSLSEAKIIIGGGRGMRDAVGFSILYDLASSLNGEVAGTRVAVENGWISEKNQVGQTGQTIQPDLYIACGISGALQHRAGIMNSKFIVAINKDPNAPIFKTSNWGVVGDVFDILPEFIRYIQTATKNTKF